MAPWALDSGAYTELSLYGHWQTRPADYAAEVRRFDDQVGRLQWASICDWMCEPHIRAKTGLSIQQHQLRTVASYRDLLDLLPRPDLWAPVLQGETPDDYLKHLEMYTERGFDLFRAPVVGVGSVCRRQRSLSIYQIFETISKAAPGLRLHGFGVKTQGIILAGQFMASADSTAWAIAKSREKRTDLSAWAYAMRWRERTLRRIGDVTRSPLRKKGWYRSTMSHPLYTWQKPRRIELIHADCLQALHDIAAGSIDVIITSPPYNIGTNYGDEGYKDSIPRPDYLRWFSRVLVALKRVLATDGSFFLNVGGKPSDPWLPFQLMALIAEDADKKGAESGFVVQNVFHWIKSISIDPEDTPSVKSILSVGHFKPINSQRFENDLHEFVFHLTHDGRTPIDRLAIGVPYQDPSNAKRWAAGTGGRRPRGNCWFIPYPTIQDRERDRPHPATFPPSLALRCLRLAGKTGRVLDPFVGLGSAAEAAVDHGNDFIGIDIDSYFLGVAKARIDRKTQTVGRNGAPPTSAVLKRLLRVAVETDRR